MDTTKRPEFNTGYMDRAVTDLPGIIKQAKKDLRGIGFDTLVGTGFSGSVVIPTLALDMGLPWLLVRKENDDSHHGPGRLVGNLGKRWLFVDDFVSSGTTLRRVHEKVQMGASLNDKTTEFVGVWQYCWADPTGWKPADQFSHTLFCEWDNCKC